MENRQAPFARFIGLYSCLEAARLDGIAQVSYCLPGLLLMEGAGRAAWAAIRSDTRFGTGGRVLVLAGRGNNGGDALVIARLAWQEGLRNLSVVMAPGRRTESCEVQHRILRSLGVPLVEGLERFAVPNDTELVVDGLFGVGLSGPMKDDYVEVVRAVNASGALKISLDLPSGLSDSYREGYPVVKADRTLCLGFAKVCLFEPSGRKVAGKIDVVDIGFPERLSEEGRTDAALASLAPTWKGIDLDSAAYKHSRGVVSVYAGARGSTGAATLSADAALRSGAGLVSLYVDPDIYPVVAAAGQSVMVVPWDQAAEPRDRPDAAVVGPGWGRSKDRAVFLSRVIDAGWGGVLDADAVHLVGELARERPELRLERWVLTPHPGEFRSLTESTKDDVDGRTVAMVRSFAEERGCVVVYKAHVCVLAAPGRSPVLVDGMNPFLGTAGSGDVLAGCIGGLYARGFSPFDAALLGVLVHQEAGRRAAAIEGFFDATSLGREVARVSARGLG